MHSAAGKRLVPAIHIIRRPSTDPCASPVSTPTNTSRTEDWSDDLTIELAHRKVAQIHKIVRLSIFETHLLQLHQANVSIPFMPRSGSSTLYIAFDPLAFYPAVGLNCHNNSMCATMTNAECKQNTCACKDDYFLDSTNSSNCIGSECNRDSSCGAENWKSALRLPNCWLVKEEKKLTVRRTGSNRRSLPTELGVSREFRQRVVHQR